MKKRGQGVLVIQLIVFLCIGSLWASSEDEDIINSINSRAATEQQTLDAAPRFESGQPETQEFIEVTSTSFLVTERNASKPENTIPQFLES